MSGPPNLVRSGCLVVHLAVRPPAWVVPLRLPRGSPDSPATSARGTWWHSEGGDQGGGGGATERRFSGVVESCYLMPGVAQR